MLIVAILLGAVAAVVFQILLLQETFSSAYSIYFFLSLPVSFLYVISAIIFFVGYLTLYRHPGEPGSVRHEDMRRSFLLFLALFVALVIRWGVVPTSTYPLVIASKDVKEE